MKTVGYCAHKLWNEVCRRVKHACVFMDDNSAECLHWNGGLSRLLNAGALEVKELSPIETTDSQKVVFVMSTSLFDAMPDTVRTILQSSHCQYAIAITTVNFLTHVFVKNGSLEGEPGDIVEHFEQKLLEWMGDMNYTAEVLHIPVTAAEISPNLFILPAFSELQPLLDRDLLTPDLVAKTTKSDRGAGYSLSDISVHSLPSNIRVYYKCVASCIHDLLEEMEVKEEIFSLGHTSRLLAQELENFPPARSRRKTSQSQVSLLFVDRTLDLCTPTSHSCESLLDRVLHTLPRLPGHKNDVMIDMSSLSSAHNVCCETIAPGCLADITNIDTRQTLVLGKHKETLMKVNRELIEAAVNEKIHVKLSVKKGRSGHEQLSSTAALFQQNSQAIDDHLGILHVSLALSQTLSHPSNRHHDNRAAMEKLVLQSVDDDGGQSVLTKLSEAFVSEMQKATNDRSYTLDDFLTLLVHVYSMLGHSAPHRHSEECQLQEKFAEKIMEEMAELPPITKHLVGSDASYGRVSEVMEDVWVTLHSLSRSRQHLKQFSDIVTPGTDSAPTSHSPLLSQLLRCVLDPNKPDLIDLEHVSSAFKDFLKSGFGFFKSVNRPRPDNSPTCIVFVVGGLTGSEVKMVHDVMSLFKAPTQVVLGSTRLVTPSDITHNILCSDRLHSRINTSF